MTEKIEEEEKDKTRAVPKSRYGLLEKLLSLLAGERELNSVLAGYFAKVLQVLLEKRKLEVLGYLFNYREHITNLLRRSKNKSVAEVLHKILSNEDKFLTGLLGTEYLPEKAAVIDELLVRMKLPHEPETIANNAAVLCSLVETRQHLDYLMSESVLKRVFELVLSRHPPSLFAGLSFLISLNRLNLPPPPPPADAFGYGNSERK